MKNLAELLPKCSVEEKREIFMILDIAMKQLHNEDLVISNFDPRCIKYQKGEIKDPKEIFECKHYLWQADTKEKAVMDNIIGMATLAFNSYFPERNFDTGLINAEAIRNNYRLFEYVFPAIDKAYYRSVLVDSFIEKRLPAIPYYYDYVASTINNTNDASKNNSSIKSYVKATETGKLMTDKNSESAFSTTFALTCMVSATLVLVTGLALYFLK